MRQPAHDELVSRQQLLAIDAEVLARLVRSSRHGEAPGDQRRDILGPAGLHRQPVEIYIGTFPDDLLTRCRRAFLRSHVEHLHEYGPGVLPGVLPSFRWLGLLEKGKELSDITKCIDRV